MGTPYTWHPGSDRIGSSENSSIGLLPDEIFSSWLVRYSIFRGVDPHTFTGSIWRAWRPWCYDIDRAWSDEKLIMLSNASGIPVDELKAGLLQSIMLKMGGAGFLSRTIWPWILAVGTSAGHRTHGLQFCPQCLKEDSCPYFRIQWRFAWNTVCTAHGCELLDCCPECSAPVDLRKITSIFGRVEVCSKCGANLKSAGIVPYAGEAVCFQKTTDNVLLKNSGRFHDKDIDSTEWFMIARVFSSMIRRTNQFGMGVITKALVDLGVDAPWKGEFSTNLGCELLRTEPRRKLLEGVSRLMETKRDDFLEAFIRHRITRQGMSHVTHKSDVMPPSLEGVTAMLQDHPIKPGIRGKSQKRFRPKSRAEVRIMMAQLENQLKRSGK